jgi:hypothetical protein
MQAQALQKLLLALEENFDLVTSLDVKEVDPRNFVIELDGYGQGNAQMRWGWFKKVVGTARHIVGIGSIWL